MRIKVAKGEVEAIATIDGWVCDEKIFTHVLNVFAPPEREAYEGYHPSLLWAMAEVAIDKLGFTLVEVLEPEESGVRGRIE